MARELFPRPATATLDRYTAPRLQDLSLSASYGGGSYRPVGSQAPLSKSLGMPSRARVNAELAATQALNRELAYRVGALEDRLLDQHVAYSRAASEAAAVRVLGETVGRPASVGARWASRLPRRVGPGPSP